MAKRPTELFMPKRQELKEQCKSCPFRQGNDFDFGEVLNKLRVTAGKKPLKGWDLVSLSVGAKEQIREEVKMNGEFICHHTAYEVSGKALVKKEESSFRQCPGATKHHRSQ